MWFIAATSHRVASRGLASICELGFIDFHKLCKMLTAGMRYNAANVLSALLARIHDQSHWSMSHFVSLLRMGEDICNCS